MTDNRVEEAVTSMQDGKNCSQAIFSVYGKQLGVDSETALKITSAFGGGINSTGNVCGAVTGAIMAIGLKHGGEGMDDQMKSMGVSNEFTSKFKDRNNTIICRDLINHDLLTPEDIDYAFKSGVFNNCPKYVKDAAEILDIIL